MPIRKHDNTKGMFNSRPLRLKFERQIVAIIRVELVIGAYARPLSYHHQCAWPHPHMIQKKGESNRPSKGRSSPSHASTPIDYDK